MTELETTEYDLERSIKKFGVLVPVIKDKQGNVIDGMHRLELEPNAPVYTIDIKDPKQRAMIRLVINLDRRKLSSQEKTMLLGEIAEATGWKSQEIADALGKSQTWVLKYLPEQYKDKEKAEAGSIGGDISSATRRVAKSQDLIEDKVECQRCHTFTSEPKTWKNGLKTHTLCESCNKRAILDPLNFHRYFELLEKKLPESLFKKPEPKTAKPSDFDSYAEKQAHMKVQHSEMEQTILQLLMDKGVTPVQIDRSFCLVSTTPDFVFPKLNLAVYLDFTETHQGKEDRDQELRDLLEKRHGMRVVSIPYKSNSKHEADRILEQIVKEASP